MGAVTGKISGNIALHNEDKIAFDAKIEESTVWMEYPLTPGLEEYASVFAHYLVPEMKIGIGDSLHQFSSELHVTNKTIFDWWMQQLSTSVDVNTHLKPDCSVLPIDPLYYRLNVDKHIICKGLSVQASEEDGVEPSTQFKCDFKG